MTERRAGIGNIKSISLMVACIQGSDAGQKCFKISRIFNLGGSAVTVPHKVRPCNCTGRSPDQIGIDSE